jgi:hypothetical protein
MAFRLWVELSKLAAAKPGVFPHFLLDATFRLPLPA